MHLTTLRPRESSFDKFIPPARSLFLDTSITRSKTDSLQQQKQAQRQKQSTNDVVSWYECASYSDIQDAMAAGVPTSRILYTSPKSSPAPLRLAARLGVNAIAVDSSEDLLKVRTYHPQARLVLRINAGDMAPPTAAFMFALEMVDDLLEQAASFQLQVIGVKFHVNSVGFAVCGHAVEPSDLHQKALDVERKLESMGIRADLVPSASSTQEIICTPESPLAFPDFVDAQFTRNAFTLVS